MDDIQAITFDLDDTLWPIAPVIERAETALHDWFQRHHPEVTDRFDPAAMRDVRERIGEASPELAHDLTRLRQLALAHIVTAAGKPARVAREAFEVFYAARNRVTLYPDTLPGLRRLADRYRLGTISNGNADIARIGLSRHFRFTVSARQAGVAKPHPDIFRRAGRLADVPPDAILHVGDCPEHDVAGGHRAGFRTVLVDRDGRHARHPLRNVAELTVTNLGELADRLLGPAA